MGATLLAAFGLHIGTCLQHMGLFQHMGKKIPQKGQHMGNTQSTIIMT